MSRKTTLLKILEVLIVMMHRIVSLSFSLVDLESSFYFHESRAIFMLSMETDIAFYICF